MDLTPEEIKNIFIFLQRAELKGSESITHANLLVKFDKEIREADPVTESDESD